MGFEIRDSSNNKKLSLQIRVKCQCHTGNELLQKTKILITNENNTVDNFNKRKKWLALI